MNQFVFDIHKIREQASQSLAEGAVTSSNTTDRTQVLQLLDAALSTEWICVLRYSQHAITASGLNSESISEHFREHARQEMEHALAIAERIDQLGGKPVLEPKHMAEHSHSYYVECESLIDMIKENLIAERIAIMSYTEMIRFIGEDDPTTRRMLEGILEVEEEHADDMANLLDRMDPREIRELQTGS